MRFLNFFIIPLLTTKMFFIPWDYKVISLKEEVLKLQFGFEFVTFIEEKVVYRKKKDNVLKQQQK